MVLRVRLLLRYSVEAILIMIMDLLSTVPCEQDMAREWASAKYREGYLNAYSFNTDSLDNLDLSNHTVLH